VSYSKKNVKQSNKEQTTPEHKSDEDVAIINQSAVISNQSAVISNAPRAPSAGIRTIHECKCNYLG
jgi:hypothetical protein